MCNMYKTILLIFVIFSLTLSFPIQQSEEMIVVIDNSHHEYITSNDNCMGGRYFIVETNYATRIIVEISMIESLAVFAEKIHTHFINNIDSIKVINKYIPFYGKINHRKQLPRCNTFDEESICFYFRCFLCCRLYA